MSDPSTSMSSTLSGDPAGRFELLYRVSDAMISTLEPADVLQLILEQAVHILGATSGSLILMDKNEPDVLNIEVAYNLDSDKVQRMRLRLGEGVTGIVAQSGKPIVVPDVRRDPQYVELDPRIQSEIAAPLKLADQTIGVLNLDSTRAGAFSASDLDLLVPLANHAAKVIQNAQLYDSVRQKAEALRLLQSISRSISGSLDLNEVFRGIVEGAVRLLGAKLSTVLLLDESGQTLHPAMSHGLLKRYRPHPALPVRISLLGQAVLQKQPVAVADVQLASRFQQKEQAREEGLHALIAVPMLLGGEAIGILTAYFDQVRMPGVREIDLLTALADQSVTAVQNARLHERVLQMEEQVRHQDKMAAVGETASGLAHEIRNPLAVINMLVSSMDGDFEEDDPRREDIRVIRKNISHIHGLVEELLNLARYRPSMPQPADLRQIVENALALLNPRMSRQQIKVRRQYEESLPQGLADPGRMHQVLINLLQNAIDAIGTRGEITVSLGRAVQAETEAAGLVETGEYLALSVHDTGAGIAAEAYQRLFEPFNTTKEQGVGLGLSIVKRIVEEHGGKITVKSSSGAGTSFTLFLPVAVRRKRKKGTS